MYKILLGSLKERDYIADMDLIDNIILKWMLEN